MKKSRLLIISALLLATLSVQAQFYITRSNGKYYKLNWSQIYFVQNGDTDQWSISDNPDSYRISYELSRLIDLYIPTVDDSLHMALDDYTAPAYNDYYVNIAGWDQRGSWNLANIHDPTIVKADDGWYYMYQTDASYGNAHTASGGHFLCRRSTNLVTWSVMGPVMKQLPEWVEPKLNEIRAAMGLSPTTADLSQCGYWAPCVRRVNAELYRMYYVITIPGVIDGEGTWGERSFIGLMETSNPADINSWEDKGYVVTNYSDRMLDFRYAADDWQNCYFKYNAIDPTYIITPEGEHWLIYGSWHSGFAAVQLNPETGKTISEQGLPWGDTESQYGQRVYTRLFGDRWQGSEAPEVVYRDGWYYLFLAYDELSVAYNTRVVRSQNINGPYYNICGDNVSNGGDALPIVTHPYKFSNSDGWVGISHCAVFDDGQGNWFYCSQGRLPAGVNNNPYSNALMMGHVRRILWTTDGWPIVLPERYGAVPQASIREEELIGQWENITLTYKYQQQIESVTFTLGENHTVTEGLSKGNTWSFDAENNTLTIGSRKLYLAREVDWEASPRRATIVYAGYDTYKSANMQRTFWGKKVQ